MLSGFLDTEGILHECASWEHTSKATSIIKEMNMSNINNGVEAEECLQKLGWLVVRNTDIYGLIGYLNDNGEVIYLSKAQKKWLEDNYEKLNYMQRECADDIIDRS